MKVFILCGGYGTRLDHESKIIAKPMVRIGNEPILFHLIKNFSLQGFNDFVLCLGYKKNTIIDYFTKEKKNFCTVSKFQKKHIELQFKYKKVNTKINLIDTGIKSGTGGRIKIAFKNLKLSEDIIMTYGDGLSSIPIKRLLRFHNKNKSIFTISAVRPKHRYGILKINKKNKLKLFDNSNKKSDIYVNGGFHVISKNCINKVSNRFTFWEKEPMSYFLKREKIFVFKYDGFWKSLDTLKDKNDFNKLYREKKYIWKPKL
tara:strand:+ start:260 stop:1036 length:777 start_codon:yes stop_codon:yes gene_type:complete